jgi:hypothetical protein
MKRDEYNYIAYGGAKPTDAHLASIIHCYDDEIISWLEKRERRKQSFATLEGSWSGLILSLVSPASRRVTMVLTSLGCRHPPIPEVFQLPSGAGRSVSAAK